MMRIIEPWFANAAEISARTPNLMGVPDGAPARADEPVPGDAAADAALGAVVADAATTDGDAAVAGLAAGAAVAATAGGAVGATAVVALQAVSTAATSPRPIVTRPCRSL
ncbi:MAG: hypothetical protein NVSMB2_04110 [Chloroflexota bacterium]